MAQSVSSKLKEFKEFRRYQLHSKQSTPQPHFQWTMHDHEDRTHVLNVPYRYPLAFTKQSAYQGV